MNGLYDTRFIVLDTETTGNNTEKDRPIEIAAVEWIGGASGHMRTWHVDPGMPIKPSASAVHHLTENDIEGAPTLDEVEDDIKDFVGESPMVIHNSAFDLAMLPFFKEHPTICSLRLARHIWRRGEENEYGEPLPNHKAQVLRYWLDLNVDTKGLAAHRAGADILVTGYIFQAAIDKYLELGKEDSLRGFMEFVKSPIEYPAMPHGSYSGVSFNQLPDKFVDYYLNPARNANPDSDVLLLMRAEKARRLKEEQAIREQMPSMRSAFKVC